MPWPRPEGALLLHAGIRNIRNDGRDNDKVSHSRHETKVVGISVGLNEVVDNVKNVVGGLESLLMPEASADPHVG